jgi:hypothetical protein
MNFIPTTIPFSVSPRNAGASVQPLPQRLIRRTLHPDLRTAVPRRHEVADDPNNARMAHPNQDAISRKDISETY